MTHPYNTITSNYPAAGDFTKNIAENYAWGLVLIMRRGKILLTLLYITSCFILAVVPSYSIVCNENTICTDILFSVDASYDVNEITSAYNDAYTFNNVKEIFRTGEEDEVYYSAQVVHDRLYSDDDLIMALKSGGIFGVVEKDHEFRVDEKTGLTMDTYMKDQWYLDRTDAKKAWDMLQNSPGDGVVVAVIDTGVNYSHPDIKSNMWINEKEYYGIPGYDDDGNGIADDIYGADIIEGTGDPSDCDESGHGTHVAGIIAMTAGNGGGCGIAYGTRIMAIKAGNSDGKFYMSDIVNAVHYAVTMGADVINMSLGTYVESDIIRDVMEKASKKCILVAAAGNDSLSNTEGAAQNAKDVYPAAYPFVIGVMAEDKNGLVTSWSNYDAEPHSMIEYEMSAPGLDILSTSVGKKYAYMSGTSMAAPMVSAAAAILYASVDKDNTDDPLKYVVGQLTQAGTQSSVKTNADGRTIRYKSLNIADALDTEPQVNVEIGNIRFKDASGNGMFRDEYTFYGAGKKQLYCGFVVDNAWSRAGDVAVKVSSADGAVQVNGGVIHIGKMDACSKRDLGFGDGGDKNGAVSLTFDTETNRSYTFLLTFEISGKMDGKEEVVSQKTVSKTITVHVKEAETKNDAAPQTHTGPAALSSPTRPNITAFGSYIDISWDNLLGADGYYVYRSKKPAKGYKRIAAVQSSDGFSYRDKNIKNGTMYYYKIKAYFSDGNESPYSGIAYGIRLGRVKGVSYERSSHKPGYVNSISWKKLGGASKYVIYCSERKSGGYKKLAVTSKKKYNHRFPAKKTYYYKVRAYARCGAGKTYGKYSKVIKVRR